MDEQQQQKSEQFADNLLKWFRLLGWNASIFNEIEIEI
jgi:hypothetical protein